MVLGGAPIDFGKSFDEVKTGRLSDRRFTDTLDLFLVTGVARK